MSRINPYMDSAIVGLQNPLTFVAGYGTQGMIQQLINLLIVEEMDGDRARLNLDKMSPPARDALYLILTNLRDTVTQTVFFANGGNPFTATTGWADGGAEAANNVLSEDDNNLIATLTAGGGLALQIFASFTTVIGITYDVTFLDLTVEDACALSISNAAVLSAPLATLALTEIGGPEDDGNYPTTTLRFTATAVTTFFGTNYTTTPADGILQTLGGVVVAPVVPAVA